MFRSEFSGKLYGPEIKPVKVVIKKRQVEYKNIVKEKEKISQGFETAREITVGPDEVLSVQKKYNLIGE